MGAARSPSWPGAPGTCCCGDFRWWQEGYTTGRFSAERLPLLGRLRSGDCLWALRGAGGGDAAWPRSRRSVLAKLHALARRGGAAQARRCSRGHRVIKRGAWRRDGSGGRRAAAAAAAFLGPGRGLLGAADPSRSSAIRSGTDRRLAGPEIRSGWSYIIAGRFYGASGQTARWGVMRGGDDRIGLGWPR